MVSSSGHVKFALRNGLYLHGYAIVGDQLREWDAVEQLVGTTAKVFVLDELTKTAPYVFYVSLPCDALSVDNNKPSDVFARNVIIPGSLHGLRGLHLRWRGGDECFPITGPQSTVAATMTVAGKTLLGRRIVMSRAEVEREIFWVMNNLHHAIIGG